MLSKSLIQFSVDGWVYVPSLLFTWGQTMVDVTKIMGPPSKVSIHILYTHCPQSCSRSPPTHTSSRDSWTLKGKSGSVFCGVTDFLLDLVHTRFCLSPPRVCFPVLCKFWQLYGGVNGNLLQEGFCHTQVCCTQSPLKVIIFNGI